MLKSVSTGNLTLNSVNEVEKRYVYWNFSSLYLFVCVCVRTVSSLRSSIYTNLNSVSETPRSDRFSE